ncbi:uncharacterized protein LOC106089839 [Stomoxys calcitrans]|uniref:uncharacterized protein LOC106089839 n=1 Tax=Stomoxys calcitrans TaxID=35570 RepID=UPI0027E34600|nr:uncharacterized protein LOC106089839 [Stomoxys calcitrans]
MANLTHSSSSMQISCSIERSIFEHPSEFYESYQQNGTKYLKSRKQLDAGLQAQLNACEGEIFIHSIPAEVRAETIAEIASKLGEVYVLRYKVNFSGLSRGFAYLQYMDPSLMQYALTRLERLLRLYALPMIKVCQSRNRSVLLLKRANYMKPKAVIENLQSLVGFQGLMGIEVRPGYYEYKIIFKSNEEAVHARREILRVISRFGRNAALVWHNDHLFDKYKPRNYAMPDNLKQALKATYPEECRECPIYLQPRSPCLQFNQFH